MSWQKFAHVQDRWLNEWFVLCSVEAHERTWFITLEEMSAIAIEMMFRIQRIELKLVQAETRMKNTLGNLENYSNLVDEGEMLIRKTLQTLRERQFLFEKRSSVRPSAPSN